MTITPLRPPVAWNPPLPSVSVENLRALLGNRREGWYLFDLRIAGALVVHDCCYNDRLMLPWKRVHDPSDERKHIPIVAFDGERGTALRMEVVRQVRLMIENQ